LPLLPENFFRPDRERYAANGERRATVALLDGCVMPLLFPEINRATVRVLQRNGCDVLFPQNQACCGALNVHNGETAIAKKMARQNLDAFLAADCDAIVVNAAGCGAMMKEYAYLLRDDVMYASRARHFSSLVKDASEFLSDIGLVAVAAPIAKTVTYQDPCHLAHGQRVRTEPRNLLAAIPGLKIVEMTGADRCCGSAGIYNITHPAMSKRLLEEKMASVKATKAEAIVAPNPGCMLQLAYGSREYGPTVEVYHLIDLLDRAYAEAEHGAGS
jgi:glycolate oxidase iron-sulfur subunit